MAGLTRWMKRNTKKAKPKRKQKVSTKSKRTSDLEPFGWEQARVFVVPFLAIVGLSGAALGGWLGQPHLINYINQHHEAVIEVQFTAPPVKVEGVKAQLVLLVNEIVTPEPIGTYARESLLKTHAALVATGWFDAATLSLRRDLITDSESPTGMRDVITVSGPFRLPFALVRNGNSDFLIDRDGHRLPVQYAVNTVDALPVFVGGSAGPPAVGSTWAGRDLADGIELLTYLKKIGPTWLAQVREINIANAQGVQRGEPHLVLVTDRGYRIAWGRALGDEKGIDQPPADKIRVLNEYATQRSGRIGDPLGLLHIDQPLATLDRSNGG